MVSGIYYDKDEPEMGVTTCEGCQTELQVSRDPVSGEMRAERVRKEGVMSQTKSSDDAGSLVPLIAHLRKLRDKIHNAENISEDDKNVFRMACEVPWPKDPGYAVRGLDDVIKEKRQELSGLKKR